jgi:hypothetical protein
MINIYTRIYMTYTYTCILMHSVMKVIYSYNTSTIEGTLNIPVYLKRQKNQKRQTMITKKIYSNTITPQITPVCLHCRYINNNLKTIMIRCLFFFNNFFIDILVIGGTGIKYNGKIYSIAYSTA